MSLRRFFAMIIAVVMLAAPLAMPASAMAVSAPDHSMSAAGDHCADEQGSTEGNAADPSCCIAMFTAVTAAAVRVEAQSFGRLGGTLWLARFADIYLAELATPPPRLG